MGVLWSRIRRRRVLVAFAAGVFLTLAAVAVVTYLVLADQRRSARVLAAALTQALQREVEIERVTDLGPSRVVLRGLRLSAARGWPADVTAEQVEASGPLVAAARGEAAPVRLLVTRPTVVAAGGGAAGAAALEGLRQGLMSFLHSAALLDVAMTGGVIQVPGPAPAEVTFDATVQKGSDQVRGEIGLRGASPGRFTLALAARAEGETLQVDLTGVGGLEPLSPWLPPALVRVARATPVDGRVQLGVSPGDRAAGRISARLGDLMALEGSLSIQDQLVRLSELRATADLAFAGSTAGLEGALTGRAELADGELTWALNQGGWPRARATLHVLDATLPASAAGVDARVRGMEARLSLEPREGGASARGELRGDRVEVAGLELAPVATPLRVDLDAGGAPARVELTALTAQVLGMPLRGTVAYDVARARADARLDASAARLDPVARHFGVGGLGPSDEVRAGSLHVDVTALDARGLSDGKVAAELRSVTLRQTVGEAAMERATLGATVAAGRASIAFNAAGIRGALPYFEGRFARVDGSADVARDGEGARLVQAAMVGRDDEGREMLQMELGRPTRAGPVRLTARLPALERLAPLWPSIPRQVTGSATVELQAPDVGFGTYDGRVALRAPTAELLGGRLSLRDLSADLPVRRGAAPAGAGPEPGGPVQIGELVGYGLVVYDVRARARAMGERLILADLQYGLYAGEGRGTVELSLAGDGPIARAQLRGEGVRLEDFVAAYGIRGGTITGLMRYDLDMRYGHGRLGADGQFLVPEGGTVTIELLDRLLGYAQADPTGVVRRALGNLRAFDYKTAEATVRTASDDVRVSLSLHGRERFGIFPPRVKEINVRDMPISFLYRQFPSQTAGVTAGSQR